MKQGMNRDALDHQVVPFTSPTEPREITGYGSLRSVPDAVEVRRTKGAICKGQSPGNSRHNRNTRARRNAIACTSLTLHVGKVAVEPPRLVVKKEPGVAAVIRED